MVQVYSEPLCRRHYAGWLSEALLVRIGLCLIAIAVSLVVAFATGGFWVKIKPTQDQPTVHYTYDALLVFEGAAPGQEQVWSTSSVLNAQFQASLAPASVQVGEVDHNFDGKPDAITFSATVASLTPIHGVKALLQFNYSFDSNIWLDLYGFAYLQYSSYTPGGSLYTDGDLLLRQLTPITDRKYNGQYNLPMLNSTASSFATTVEGSTSLDLPNILHSYMTRNYTTVYSNVHNVWMSSSATEFTLDMYIRIPPNQVVWYRPQVIEMLKFGWIQFLATYICMWWIFWWLQWFIFRNRLLTTHVVSDVQPRAQRF